LARGDRSRQGRERTAEERERDRQERERRRAQGGAGGAPASPDADPFEARPGVAPAAGTVEHEHDHPTPPAEPPHGEEPPHAYEPLQEDAPLPEDVSLHEDRPLHGGAPPDRDVSLHEDQPLHDDPLHDGQALLAGAAPHEDESATAAQGDDDGAVAVPAPESLPDAPLPDAPSPAAPEAPLELPPPLTPRRGRSARPLSPAARTRGRSPLARVGALIALAAAIAAVILLLSTLLSSKGGKSTPAPAVLRVVIPEGETRVQIAEIAAKAGLRGSYRDASRRSPLLNPAHYGAPRSTPDLEGFLFPATYDEYPGALASRLVADQVVAFKENFGSSLFARARALHVTPYQLLIVASMVEREAQIPTDRAKIAAVVYNRLARGMPLGIDATIYYAVELQKGVATYTKELTEAQLHINSPYNTRTHVGLPPTPIANPGLASIKAAANPAHVSYLYYVAGADGCGEHVFSTTLAAFEANAAAYQAAIQKNGGHPPSCKKK
jgi:cell division protein YceG involved in septum cleavage